MYINHNITTQQKTSFLLYNYSQNNKIKKW